MHIAIAGATGYLGEHLVKTLNRSNIAPTVITRRWDSEHQETLHAKRVLRVNMGDAATLSGRLLGIDTIISTVGITRQKDNLTYMDVDYQANMNLLQEALRCGVKKFVYISVLHGEHLRHIKLCEAKERFVDALKAADIEYLIIRPSGFFSDMRDFLKMAQRGSVYLFGRGAKRLNPIHGEDLAHFCLEALEQFHNETIEVGGPKVYTHIQLAHLACDVLKKERKVIHIPDIFRRLMLWGLPVFSTVQTYGPIEFFLSVMDLDMVATEYGEQRLEDFFNQQKENL